MMMARGTQEIRLSLSLSLSGQEKDFSYFLGVLHTSRAVRFMWRIIPADVAFAPPEKSERTSQMGSMCFWTLPWGAKGGGKFLCATNLPLRRETAAAAAAEGNSP